MAAERLKQWKWTLEGVTEFLDGNIQRWFPESLRLERRCWLFFIDEYAYFSPPKNFPFHARRLEIKHYPGDILSLTNHICFIEGWRPIDFWKHMPVLAGFPPWKG